MVRQQIARCWNVPAGARDAKDLVVEIRCVVEPGRHRAPGDDRRSGRMAATALPRGCRKRAARLFQPALPAAALARREIRDLERSGRRLQPEGHLMKMKPSNLRRCRCGSASASSCLSRRRRRAPSCGSTSPAARSSRCRSRSRPFPAAPRTRARRARDIAGVVSADLERSGLFRPLDPRSFIQNVIDRATQPRFPDWRQINAQALVTGTVKTQGDGRLQGRVPAVGRLCRAAAGRVWLHDDPAELAPHRPHHRRRDLQADHRRGRLFRYPDRLCRRNPGRGASASSASPSWTRTAPTTVC